MEALLYFLHTQTGRNFTQRCLVKTPHAIELKASVFQPVRWDARNANYEIGDYCVFLIHRVAFYTRKGLPLRAEQCNSCHFQLPLFMAGWPTHQGSGYTLVVTDTNSGNNRGCQHRLKFTQTALEKPWTVSTSIKLDKSAWKFKLISNQPQIQTTTG